MSPTLAMDRADIARRRALALPPRFRWLTLTAWGVDVALLARDETPGWLALILVAALGFASHQLLAAMKTTDGFDREDAKLSAAHPAPAVAPEPRRLRICNDTDVHTQPCDCGTRR